MAITTGILTGGANSHETTSEEANQVASDFCTAGIVGATTNTSGVAPATGGFAVNAQGTPDMTVAVSTGTAYVTATPSGQSSQLLRVKNSATSNVTIASNTSGSTKYDWVYISISAANAANPNTAADNVATLVTSRSSSASSDDGTPPTYGRVLAVVTVANGASSITNGNISDKRIPSLVSNSSVVATPALVTTDESTASNTYTDLTTTTDSVNVVVGTSGVLQVSIYAGLYNTTTNATYASFALSGANTLAAADTYALVESGLSNTQFNFGATFILTGLNPGYTTVKMKYKAQAGTAHALNRRVSARPL